MADNAEILIVVTMGSYARGGSRSEGLVSDRILAGAIFLLVLVAGVAIWILRPETSSAGAPRDRPGPEIVPAAPALPPEDRQSERVKPRAGETETVLAVPVQQEQPAAAPALPAGSSSGRKSPAGGDSFRATVLMDGHLLPGELAFWLRHVQPGRVLRHGSSLVEKEPLPGRRDLEFVGVPTGIWDLVVVALRNGDEVFTVPAYITVPSGSTTNSIPDVDLRGRLPGIEVAVQAPEDRVVHVVAVTAACPGELDLPRAGGCILSAPGKARILTYLPALDLRIRAQGYRTETRRNVVLKCDVRLRPPLRVRVVVSNALLVPAPWSLELSVARPRATGVRWNPFEESVPPRSGDGGVFRVPDQGVYEVSFHVSRYRDSRTLRSQASIRVEDVEGLQVLTCALDPEALAEALKGP